RRSIYSANLYFCCLPSVVPVGRLIKNFIMKKIVTCIVLVGMVFIVNAQSKPVNKTPAKSTVKSAAPVVQLRTLEDSANYAMGMSVANFYKSQGITKINSAIVIRAINDALTGKQLL